MLYEVRSKIITYMVTRGDGTKRILPTKFIGVGLGEVYVIDDEMTCAQRIITPLEKGAVLLENGKKYYLKKRVREMAEKYGNFAAAPNLFEWSSERGNVADVVWDKTLKLEKSVLMSTKFTENPPQPKKKRRIFLVDEPTPPKKKKRRIVLVKS